MPTLADIYSAIDSAKRKGSDLIRNPGASLQQIAGLALDRANAARDQLYQATDEEGIGYGPKTKALAQKMAESYNPMGMTVWHGSPYKFTKFDASKIGTGEGAQAYGHGLYVAENPKVAEEYKKALSDFDIKVNGQTFNPDDVAHRAAMSVNMAGSKLSAIKEHKKAIEDLKSRNVDWATDLANQKQKEIEYLQRTPKLPKYEEQSKGNLYKIDLPDEHIEKMLDYDKSWMQQPENIRNSIDVSKLLKYYNTEDMPTSQVMYHVKQNMSPAAFSEFLSKKGIPGIKYLDEGSRDAKQGTRNFVVFPGNEHLLSIQDINGNPVK